jgi:hypothetical protein
LQILESQRGISGGYESYDADTLNKMKNLEATLRAQGQWQEAEHLHVRILSIGKHFRERIIPTHFPP